ncbi:MAG: O-antigen ligase family protein [Phycisphaerae bacterium]
MKTLQFRWHYWMASAAMWADHFWLGVGGGNFGDGYLTYRLMGAEEAVKAPHNIWMHALAQFGLGAVFFMTAVAAVASGRGSRAEAPQTQPRRAELGATLAAVVVFAVGARTLLWDWSDSPAVWTWEILLPAMGLVAGLVLAAWRLTGGAGLRFCLRAGLLAVLLHNIVTYSLWTPATAGLFWLTGGSLLATPADVPSRGGRRWMAWSLAGVALAGWVACALWLWAPVYRRTMHADAALQALRDGDPARAIDAADAMVSADPLDPTAADDAAKLMLLLSPRDRVNARTVRLGQAQQYADTAWERDGASFNVAHRRVMTCWYRHFPDAFALAIRQRLAPGQVEQFRQSIARRGEDWLALHDLATAYALDGKWHEAVAWFARVAKLRPQAPQAQYNEALATWMAGMQGRAREAWRKAGLRTPPQGLGELIRVALQRNPRDARLRLDYAELALQTGAADVAKQLLRDAKEIDAALDTVSVQKLSKQERKRIEAMEAHAAVVEEMRAASENE